MLQIFNYNNNDVTFKRDGNVIYVNATEMAKPFGKLPAGYYRNESTKEFLAAISSSMQLSIDELIQSKEGGNGGGTWMHEDVALDFAQWLSPVFRVWCNQKIKELLTTGKAEIVMSPEKIIAEGYRLAVAKVEQLEESNKLLTQTVKEQAPKVQYHDQVLQSESLILTSVIAKELGMSAMALNKLLHEKKIIFTMGGTWLLYAKYQNKGYTGTKTHTFTDTYGNSRTSIIMCWTEAGRMFIHGLIKQVKAA